MDVYSEEMQSGLHCFGFIVLLFWHQDIVHDQKDLDVPQVKVLFLNIDFTGWIIVIQRHQVVLLE